MKEVWEIINSITGRSVKSAIFIPGDTPEVRLNKWYLHFKNLLSPENDEHDQSPVILPKTFNDSDFKTCKYNTSKFTISELSLCIESLNNNKATGVDNISAEVLKVKEIHPILLAIFNHLFVKGVALNDWHLSLLIPVFKKGDNQNCNNYRGIALMSIVAKLYNKLLLNRLENSLDDKLRYNQNGFRRGRSTTQHILAIKRIFEECKTHHNQNLVTTFIDFSKAFDSIKWTYIKAILISYNVPDIIVNAIMSIYIGAKAAVSTSDGISEQFDLSVGVLQGDTLAPYLFVIVIDYVMRLAMENVDAQGFMLTMRKSDRVPATYITDLIYADDIALFSNTRKAAQILINRVEEEAKKVGLHINCPKTKYMVIGNKDDNTPLVTEKGQIEQVKEFKYLGSYICTDIYKTEIRNISNKKQIINDSDNIIKPMKIKEDLKDLNINYAKAWSNIVNMNYIWQSTSIPDDHKLQIFQTTIESILLYGAETWTLTTSDQNKLDGHYGKLYRYALNIKWDEKVSNEKIYKLIDPVTVRLRERRLRFAGHCFRGSKNKPVSHLIFWSPTTKLISNKNTYVKTLLKDIDVERNNSDPGFYELNDIKSQMSDRAGWKKVISTTKRNDLKKVAINNSMKTAKKMTAKNDNDSSMKKEAATKKRVGNQKNKTTFTTV